MSFGRARKIFPLICEVFNKNFSSGSIRSAGGGIAKRGEVNEEKFFRKLVNFEICRTKFKNVMI
jgi:hypothetical protein